MNRKTIAISVEGDRDYVEKVKRTAGANGLTIASVVRSAIDAYLFFAPDGLNKVQSNIKDSTPTDETR